MNRYAIVDLGTNSFILLIGSKDEGILFERIVNVGIGDERERIENRIKRAKDTLEEMKRISRDFKVEDISVFGTEFFRKNKEIFYELIRSLKLNGRILTPYEEAFYSHESVKSMLDGKALVVDIGGGSVEFIQSFEKRMESYTSLPIGLWKLKDKFSDNEGRIEKEKLRRFLGRILENIEGEFDKMIGIGGTFTTMAAVKLKLKMWDPIKIEGFKLDLDWIKEMEGRIFNMSEDEICELTPLAFGREKIIPVSFSLTIGIMDRFALKEVFVSTKGYRYGLLYSTFGGE